MQKKIIYKLIWDLKFLILILFKFYNNIENIGIKY